MAAQAVVLDLDGTAWDSREWYAQTAGRGDPGRSAQALAELASGVPAATVLRAAGYTKTSFGSFCRSGALPLAVFPGILEALSRLRERGVKLGAATNLPGWMAAPMADTSGIAPLLVTLVDWGATARHKPYPDPLLEAFARLGTEPSAAAWYVGDEERDALAAQAAGVMFAWASWGTGLVAPDGTDLVLRRPANLANLARACLRGRMINADRDAGIRQ